MLPPLTKKNSNQIELIMEHLQNIKVCMGTKEMEECVCGGDEAKCDFYSYKRNKSRESKPKTLFELIKLLLDNNFKLTIQRECLFENFVQITIDDTVHDQHVMATIPDEILIDYIASMTDELLSSERSK